MTLTAGNLVLSNPLTCTNTAKGDNKLYSDAKGVVPSLDLRFASQKNLNDYMTGTPLVDHQRSMGGSNLSPGTFVNSSGLIETAKVNLVSYSQEFENSYYTQANITTMQATTDVAAPDGTFTARYISAASNGRLTISSSNFTSQSGRRKSIYLKAVSGSPVVNALTQAATDPNPVTLSSTEWLRFEIDTPSSEVGGTTFVLDFRGSSTTTEVYAWGLQIEEGSAATTYIPTTNVPSAAPRFDHDPTTGESLGLLIEESRTNILLNSATLSTQSVTTSATAYTLSFYGTGTVTLSGTSTAGPLAGTGANDRVTLTFTPTAGTLTLTVTGTVSNCQLEAGSFPTSYIPTTGTALTRSADVASITGTNFSSWFNSPEGTIFSDVQTQNTSCFGWNLSDGSNNNRFVFDPGVNTGTAAAIVSGGGPTFGTPPTVLAGGGKIAFAYKPNDYGVYGNQTQLAGTSPAAVPTGLNQIGLGYRGNYAPDAYLNGTIARLTYFPDRLEDSVLQAITQ